MRNDIYMDGVDYRKGDNWEKALLTMQYNFADAIASGNKLFIASTNKGCMSLYDIYLNGFDDEAARQHYDCRACKHFIEKYGMLVTIDENNKVKSALWTITDILPTIFIKPFEAMKQKVESKQKVKYLFYTDSLVLGTPKTGIWSHYHLNIPRTYATDTILVEKGKLDTIIAYKKEDFRLLLNGVRKYVNTSVTSTALNLLNSNAVYRAEKFLPFAKWFNDVVNLFKDNIDSNLLWKIVAEAPDGYCHVSSNIVNTMYEDILSGLTTPVILAKFLEKSDPENYNRSKSTPSVTAIENAEKVIAELGVEKSLSRRYATLEELPKEYMIWENPNEDIKEPKIPYTEIHHTSPTGSIFDNIRKSVTQNNTAQDNKNVTIPVATMTWDKFKRTILPNVVNIEAKVNENRCMALVTASDETAPNIFKWNNPFSWYYAKGIDGEIRERLIRDGGKFENVEMRCSLMWNGITDLDLHCYYTNDYDNLHVFYQFPKSSTLNCLLDVDANAREYNLVSEPVENIVFDGELKDGIYIFLVHNYCQRELVNNFTVELEVDNSVESYTLSPKNEITGWSADVFRVKVVNGKVVDIIKPSDDNKQNNLSTSKWNVTGFTKVNAIIPSPNLWSEDSKDYLRGVNGDHVFFILDGCKDNTDNLGKGFLNETLKNDFREIRKVLEYYTSLTPIEGKDNASACGVGYNSDSAWNLLLRVTDKDGSTRLINIDRMD